MASNWYVSSVAYSNIQTWNSLTGGAATSVSLGKIVRQTSPTVGNERVFRCTTAGSTSTTEPSPWILTNNGTTTDGTVIWTQCCGQEAHQHDNSVTNTWTAPAARINILSSTLSLVAGTDTVYVSSDHAETQSTNLTVNGGTNGAKVISVSRTGSVPPVAADISNGASFASTGSANLQVSSTSTAIYWQGCTFDASGTSGTFTVIGGNVLTTSTTIQYYKSCTFKTSTNATTGNTLTIGSGSTAIVWDNVTVSYTNTTGMVGLPSSTSFRWKGGATIGDATNAIGTAAINSTGMNLEVFGVDLSSVTGNLINSGVSIFWTSVRFVNCKLNASATQSPSAGNFQGFGTQGYAEFLNCTSGNNNYTNSWHKYSGDITTETTITRTSGATDGAQKISRKMVSNSDATTLQPLTHTIYIWNTSTSSINTTVEIISSTTLKNDEIWAEVEYLADTGDNLSAFTNDTKATILTTNANQTSSSAAWDNSPATPVTQKVVCTFTPQKAGLIKLVVYLAKASTTVYVDPLITIT